MTVKVYHSSQSDEWVTPQSLFDTLHAAFKFDLDAAATAANAKCSSYLTAEMDALACQWWGRVWVNPPYSMTKLFVERAIEEIVAGHCLLVVMLVAARPDTKWFWRVAETAAEIRFLKGRLTFGQQQIELDSGGLTIKTNNAPFPSCVLVFNPGVSEQRIGWWDPKTETEAQYQYAPPPKPQIEISDPSQLPPEMKTLFQGLVDLTGMLEAKKGVQGYAFVPTAEQAIQQQKQQKQLMTPPHSAGPLYSSLSDLTSDLLTGKSWGYSALTSVVSDLGSSALEVEESVIVSPPSVSAGKPDKSDYHTLLGGKSGSGKVAALMESIKKKLG